MMAGNPNWWSMSNMLLPQYAAASSSLPFNSLADHNQEFPHSWSQLLLGGLASEQEEDKLSHSHFQSKKLENNWEDQILNQSLVRVPVGDVKPEVPQSSQPYNHGDDHDHEFQLTCRPSWSQVMPVSSPRSCVTSSLSSNILDFSNCKGDGRRKQHPNHSSECNTTATGGVSKKSRVQSSSTPPLKVRKEKLGDRITALHQIVSPFGKTDTASVLSEAIGYIGFLQGQIEALSSPYLSNASANTRHQNSVQAETTNFTFPEDYDQGNEDDAPKDLRSRGLCLVPVSCSHHMGSDNIGADYWTPALGGGF